MIPGTSVLLFYMAPGTLPHVEVMTPLSTIVILRTPCTPSTMYSYIPSIAQLCIPWYQQQVHEYMLYNVYPTTITRYYGTLYQVLNKS